MFTLQSSEWYRGEIVARGISPNGRLSVAVTESKLLYRLMWWESRRGGVFVHESAPYEGDDDDVPPEIRISWSTDSLVCRVFANTELLLEQKFVESRDSLARSHLIEVKPTPLEVVRAKILALRRHATDQDGAFIYKKVVTRMLDLLDEGRRYGMPDEEFYMARGDLKKAIGEYNEAITCYQHIIDASPTNIDAYIGIADGKDRLKDEAEAITWYSRAIDIATAADAHEDAKARLGWLYYQRAFLEYSIDKARSDEDYKLAKQHGYVSYENDF
jgi:tetratricopeptide (TPR) repeat protein